MAHRAQEHDALVRRVGREELRDVVVEEGQAGGSEAEGVRAEVDASDARQQERRHNPDTKAASPVNALPSMCRVDRNSRGTLFRRAASSLS